MSTRIPHSVRLLLGLGAVFAARQLMADEKPVVIDVETRTERVNNVDVRVQKLKPATQDTIRLKTDEEADSSSQFLRLKRDRNDEVVAMQTAITRYSGTYRGRKVVVDLVGAVHIGDRTYYRRLNDEFESYDAMLYELVAPAEKRIPTPALRENTGLLTTIRKVAQTLFEFEMQLDGVDYTPENFVHADLSPTELGEKIRERGENMISLFFSVMADAMKQQSKLADSVEGLKIPDIDLLAVVQDPNGAIKAKRALAEMLVQNLEMTSDEESTLARLLIADRNDAAMKVLAREIKAGNSKLALFYGAAHMPDFEKQLKAIGFEKQDERWITAWDLKERQVTQAEHLSKMITILQLIKDEL